MTTGCPVCKKEGFTIIYDQLLSPGALIVRCNHCAHIYTILKNETRTKELYTDEVYEVVENQDSFFDKILNREYGRVIKNINGLKMSKGFLLDFGCGKGKFASLAKKSGWKVKCVETASPRADYAKRVYGLDVDTRSYSGGKIFDMEFDVLTLFHVLEHIPDPQKLLSELIKHNLAKDGVVVIEVPNFKSLQARIAGSKWIHLDVTRHISHFIPLELEQIARNAGLEPKQTSFFSFHLGVLGMTDTFLKLFGYRQNIIYELKNKKRIALLLSVILLLPLTIPLEFFSALLQRGGVIRKYFIRNNKTIE